MSHNKISSATRSILADRYFEEIETLDLTESLLAELVDADNRTVRRWRESPSENPPNAANLRKIGELAAVSSFLNKELSLNPSEAQAFLLTVHIDPDTSEATTMLDHVKQGNIPLVVQRAIAESVVD